MSTYTPEQLAEIINLHNKWLRDETGGVRADLSRANLDYIKNDLYKILELTPAEVPCLLMALRDGRVDGSTYHGDCACLVGTIANVRGCGVNEITGIEPDSSRPAEIWFLAIDKGDTPANNAVSAITEKWVADWLTENSIASVVAQ